MNYTAETTLTQPASTRWANDLQARAQACGLRHLDLLIDQVALAYPLAEILQAQTEPLRLACLLEHTPHVDAASTGPLLARIDLSRNAHVARLPRLFDLCWHSPRVMILLSDSSFEWLAEHLSHCLLAEWDAGRHAGVLRFNDPRLFMAIINQLAPPARQFLLQSVLQWHWINRDGDAVAFTPPPEDPAPLWAHTLMPLREEDIMVFSAWHQAELWRRSEGLEPASFGVSSQEALMHRLVAAQLQADAAGMWSQDERAVFLEKLKCA